MKKYFDKSGIEIKVGQTITGLYPTGDPSGTVVEDLTTGELYVEDSDGDWITIESILENGCYVISDAP